MDSTKAAVFMVVLVGLNFVEVAGALWYIETAHPDYRVGVLFLPSFILLNFLLLRVVKPRLYVKADSENESLR